MKTKISLLLLLVVAFLGCGQKQSNSQTKAPNNSVASAKQIHSSELIFTPNDLDIFEKKIKQFEEYEAESKGELISEIAQSFLNTPYVEKTLEIDPAEKLVINFHGFDCTTFVESCTALASTIEDKESELTDYATNLEMLRYRNGERIGYASRLHYFSEWIKDNEHKELIQDISKSAKGDPLKINLSFMSEHSNLYPMLKEQDSLIAIVANAEKQISKQNFYYIPQEKLRMVEPFLFDGDIVAITTNINGLDVSHTGFVIRKNERVHLLHASSAQKKVVISKIPLVDYLKRGKSTTGIMVLRVQ